MYMKLSLVSVYPPLSYSFQVRLMNLYIFGISMARGTFLAHLSAWTHHFLCLCQIKKKKQNCTDGLPLVMLHLNLHQ